MENITLTKKKVFISYCHKDVPEEWIDKLANVLASFGIECVVDIYDLQLGQDLNYFMEQIKKVDKVLILLGKTYKEKANDREGGVGTETQIISNDVYNDVEQTKFIPIIINKDERGNAYLPYYLETRLYTDLSNDDLFAKNIEELVRQIHKLPKKVKPIVAEPPKTLIQKNSNMDLLLYKNNISFDEVESIVLKEMKYMKCSYQEYQNEEDEIVVRKIENSKEIRDFFIKSFAKMVDEKQIIIEDIRTFFEKAYSEVHSFEESPYYETQNDACKFFFHEIVIYIFAILYKKKKFKEICSLVKTTYFPDSVRDYLRAGIQIDYFYENLGSLENRNTRLKMNRKSIHADLLMKRASIQGLDINFADIRFTDCLILMLSEWFYNEVNKYMCWYPVTIVYTSYGTDDYLQLKKYLLSASRFEVIREMFGVSNQTEFIEKYKRLEPTINYNNRRVDFFTIPSICTLVKQEDLFSRE